MNVVIYSEDLEPITVLDLAMPALDKAAREGQLQLRVTARGTKYKDDGYITLKYEPMLTRDGGIVCVLTTKNEIDVLRAKPGWLPGQRGQLNYYLNQIKKLLGQRRD